MNKRETGTKYEALAAEYLEANGLLIQKKNYRCPKGEIDLIAHAPDRQNTIIFIEVKYRTTAAQGGPLCAVDFKKQKKISEAALWYLTTVLHRTDFACRFDVIGFQGEQLQWIQNAFPLRIRGFF